VQRVASVVIAPHCQSWRDSFHICTAHRRRLSVTFEQINRLEAEQTLKQTAEELSHGGDAATNAAAGPGCRRGAA